MTRPRDIAIKLVLFLLLGAIVNLTVAWGCALFVSFDLSSYWDDGHGGVLEPEHTYQLWLVHSQIKAGAHHISSSWGDRDLGICLSGPWPDNRPEELIREWACLARPPVASDSRGKWHYRWIDARGWPALALWTAIACDTATHANAQAVQVLGGIALDQPRLGTMRSLGNKQRFIPLHPIWPGFAINTIFYAAVLWVLFAAPGFVKRRIRRGRGRCIHCGYDLRGQPPPEAGQAIKCPECGRSAG